MSKLTDGKYWLANMRRKYHHIVNGGQITEFDMGHMVKDAEEAQQKHEDEIERLRGDYLDQCENAGRLLEILGSIFDELFPGPITEGRTLQQMRDEIVEEVRRLREASGNSDKLRKIVDDREPAWLDICEICQLDHRNHESIIVEQVRRFKDGHLMRCHTPFCIERKKSI